MRNKIFGGIGILWGSAILIHWFRSEPANDAAYAAGFNGAAIFGGLMLIVGLYAFFKQPK